MKWYVALLRGINVGGRNSLPMDELTTLLEELGLTEVRTYIQSGNVLFRADEIDEAMIASQVREVIKKTKGFQPDVLVFSLEKLVASAKANPFPEGEHEPSRLHLSFAAENPSEADLDLLNGLKAESENFKLIGDVLYLHAPDGIGRSKLASSIEKALGVPSTMRNWRTVTKLLELASNSTS
ncbi:MAG: DUF1697 domain-containing protein [Anaerolineales bacterium]|jgi:uncharacterized protein (DUF1697 family)